MTANQLAYLEYAERQRSNLANEDANLRKAKAAQLNADVASDKQQFETWKYGNEAYLRDLSALNSLSSTAKNWSQALGIEDLVESVIGIVDVL